MPLRVIFYSSESDHHQNGWCNVTGEQSREHAREEVVGVNTGTVLKCFSGLDPQTLRREIEIGLW